MTKYFMIKTIMHTTNQTLFSNLDHL